MITIAMIIQWLDDTMLLALQTGQIMLYLLPKRPRSARAKVVWSNKTVLAVMVIILFTHQNNDTTALSQNNDKRRIYG